MANTRNLENINSGYFSDITGYNNDYLTESPTKAGVLNNNQISGDVSILPDSNNRAIVIKDKNENVFLQSYDTLILKYERATGNVFKLWDGYSVTTLKHVNTFMKSFNGRTFSKREWESIEKGAIL